MTVSLSVDPFIAVYADSNPFWTIELTNGKTIYQDDDRPELEEKSAWVRAKQYIYENNLEISKVKFRFAGYEHIVYDINRDTTYNGFYFSKGVSALLSAESSKEWKFYIAGKSHKLENGEISISIERYEIPMLKKHDCDERILDEKTERKLILNLKDRQ